MLVSQATTLKVDEGNTRVVIEGVACLGFNHDRQVNRLEKADVVFHVTSREGQVTRFFTEKLGLMSRSRKEVAPKARGHADGALHHGSTVSKTGRDSCIAFVRLLLPLSYHGVAVSQTKNRQATEVQCEVAIISDAELLITRSHQDKYRLIVTSRNKCTVLTQVCT
jgi:hypothetical protein